MALEGWLELRLAEMFNLAAASPLVDFSDMTDARQLSKSICSTHTHTHKCTENTVTLPYGPITEAPQNMLHNYKAGALTHTHSLTHTPSLGVVTCVKDKDFSAL